MRSFTALYLFVSINICVFLSVTYLQMVVSETVGIPANKITVVVKQVGGGYGAKIVKPNQIAAAAAVAAIKFNLPVKVVMDLNTNMEMIGMPFIPPHSTIIFIICE
jgi:xanthine dehydrogenase molybdopterin-binding subunit B